MRLASCPRDRARSPGTSRLASPMGMRARFGHGLPVPNGRQRAFRASQGLFLPEDRRFRKIDAVGVRGSIPGSIPLAPPEFPG